jgi:hypothetical protein
MYGSNAPYYVSLMYYGMVKPLAIMGKALMSPLMQEQLTDAPNIMGKGETIP